MKRSIWLAITLTAVAAIGGATALLAQNTPNAPAGWRQRGWNKAKARLGLTDDQIARIKTELRTEKDALIAFSTKVHDAKILLREVTKKAGATEAEIRAAAANAGAAEGDLAVLKAKLHTRISPILTQEQLDKITEGENMVDDFVDGAISGFINRMVE